jgi:glyoxylase-like metal-dependent hydrolase (beta-lactamase superfamily II)
MAELKVALLPVTAFQQNCAILWDEATKRATVVDPGGDVPRIRAALDQLGVTVEQLLLTHGHIDHAGGAAELKEGLGGEVPIVGPDARDRFLLGAIELQADMYGLRGVRNVTPDRWLAEGETVVIAGQAFTVLHCPGHTPGHLVYVHTGHRFAIVGDVLFQGSIGRTDFPYGDHAALLAAIHDKLLPLGDDIAFICGHGPGSTFGAERRSNPFLRR